MTKNANGLLFVKVRDIPSDTSGWRHVWNQPWSKKNSWNEINMKADAMGYGRSESLHIVS